MEPRAVTQADIISWVEKSLGSENLVNHEINFTGTTEKGDGYLGDVVFINVKGTTKHNTEKVIDLVIKHAKSSEYIRRNSPIRDAFQCEIYFYETVLTLFKKFQAEKHVTDGFQQVPKCYASFILENMEVIVLENLRSHGYELHEKEKPLNVNHLKLILKEYGKLHALSFALKEQRNEQFNSISNVGDLFKEFLDHKGFREAFQIANLEALDILSEHGDEILHNKLQNVLQQETMDIILALMDTQEPQSVIVHGDSWNNNFMFKYENNDNTSPTNVRILDWQIISLRSPAFDLSYLIYANGGKEELDRFDELLETYYSSFSSFLRELGSDPEELFTFADLQRHWKKYALFGVLFAPTVLKVVLCRKEDVSSFEDIKEGDELGSVFSNKTIGDLDAYYRRVKAIYSHYFDYTLA